MTRIVGLLGWLAAALYLGVVLASNWIIVSDFYYPEGPWPGWGTLVEADALYGGGGLVLLLLVRLAWRRWHARAAAGHQVAKSAAAP